MLHGTWLQIINRQSISNKRTFLVTDNDRYPYSYTLVGKYFTIFLITRLFSRELTRRISPVLCAKRIIIIEIPVWVIRLLLNRDKTLELANKKRYLKCKYTFAWTIFQKLLPRRLPNISTLAQNVAQASSSCSSSHLELYMRLFCTLRPGLLWLEFH